MKTTLSRFFLLGTVATMLQSSVKAQVVTTVVTGLVQPTYILIGTLDTLYVSEHNTHRIIKITPTGAVKAFVGSGSSGSTDGTGASASFGLLFGLVRDDSGNIYATDYSYDRMRKITPGGVVSTFVKHLSRPAGLVWGHNDTLIVYNSGDGAVMKIAPSGAVVPFTTAPIDGQGLAKGSNDTLYLAGYLKNNIYKIDPLGTVTKLAGSDTIGRIDGTGAAASFNSPINIAVDTAGDLYVTEYQGNKIRKVTAAGVVTTVAGSGFPASTDGTGTTAKFHNPVPIVIVPSTGNFYIGDFASGSIRKMTPGIKVNINKYTPAASELKVYPSPFKDGFSISSTTAQRVQLMNNLGQIIQVIDIVAGEQQVSMAGQPAGIYFIKSDNGSAQRIVKL